MVYSVFIIWTILLDMILADCLPRDCVERAALVDGPVRLANKLPHGKCFCVQFIHTLVCLFSRNSVVRGSFVVSWRRRTNSRVNCVCARTSIAIFPPLAVTLTAANGSTQASKHRCESPTLSSKHTLLCQWWTVQNRRKSAHGHNSVHSGTPRKRADIFSFTPDTHLNSGC